MKLGKRYLLDCTMRDGGYLNDWAFGKEGISYIFQRQVSSGVDVIEVGFLDERRPFDPNRTIMPDTQSVDRIFGGFDKGGAMLVGMIDYGTCSLEHIQPCEETCLDGIRVIFKKPRMQGALEFCKELKKLGYQVFAQAVAISSYNDEELLELIGLVNACCPYAFSMVDTYGLLDEQWLAHLIGVIDANLDRKIVLGYHAHNNFQLGYANAMSVLSQPLERDILVDGTLYGMGKSAGNAPVELIAMYMNAHFEKQYNVTQMQEAIATSILDLYQKHPWGYTLFYYIAAANQCHPNYVSYLMNKRTLSVTAVNEILQRIPEEKKLDKDSKLIERLYLEYQKSECEDAAAVVALRAELAGKKVLMIGPGTTVGRDLSSIQDYIHREQRTVISINFVPEGITPDALFVTNARRYSQIVWKLSQPESARMRLIATSNVRQTGRGFDHVVNYSRLIDEQAEFPDNSMVMLLKLLQEVGVKEIALAGFDGYTPDTVNYFDENKEYSFVKDKADSLNRYVRTFLRELEGEVRLSFVTPSHYVQ